ncbi:hypothetical protein DFH08DRAFT_822901 [Mycena albidolilacea]|uniref:Uncharacterized protein n=1 Tax=Mycena albidolilacea TaxID=1033008 RepID=A0AAD7ECM9_9AGAR|nr:hypothetical protein DFH08DRAFT_822901 [Mycena albidolilacea]
MYCTGFHPVFSTPRDNVGASACSAHQRRSSSPTPHYPQNFQPSRPRSRSPLPAANAKRARLDDLNGFVAFGPVNDSAEPPQKLWELYLRTAIPGFRLEAPYAAYQDPNYPSHLRVTVKSRAAARALVDAWGKQTVAGCLAVGFLRLNMLNCLAVDIPRKVNTLWFFACILQREDLRQASRVLVDTGDLHLGGENSNQVPQGFNWWSGLLEGRPVHSCSASSSDHPPGMDVCSVGIL